MDQPNDDEITDAQRRRIEENRLAALAKRKARESSLNNQNPWTLFKCQKLYSHQNPTHTSTDKITILPPPPPPPLPTPPLKKFLARIEICSPDSFSVTPVPLSGSPFPGEDHCFEILEDRLANVLSTHYTQNYGGRNACVYMLKDYEMVLRSLKNSKDLEYEEIPWSTFNVVERLSRSFTSGRWIPCRPEHLHEEKVDELIAKLPQKLQDTLLPFQLEGVRFALQRGGRCLIADEMGLGKTIQAIAVASCFMSEGPILVVCPAILRYSWAEELERWLPFLLPADIHLVFGHQDIPAHLKRCPKVVVISYMMLKRLGKSISDRKWATLIVDESHHLRCTKKKSESEESKAVLDLAMNVNHIILLSGTPSLSRPYDIFHQINILWPGLLGKTKYEYARTYCSVKQQNGCQGKVYQDFSRGIRLQELNILLTQTIMIRRLKEHVLTQLPSKRRQIISLVLKKSDIAKAMNMVGGDASHNQSAEVGNAEDLDEAEVNADSFGSEKRLVQAIGIAKVRGFCEWLSIHPVMSESVAEERTETSPNSHKMIIFAHFHKVFDQVQEFLCEKGVKFVRIDCNLLSSERQMAIKTFRSSPEVKIALIGIRAGGTGLNLSVATNVVFLELPEDPSRMGQAEDRAHRHGQTNAVNIYVFCAKDTIDEGHWRRLNKSLHRVSSTVDGKYDAVHEIKVHKISHLETSQRLGQKNNHLLSPIEITRKISEGNTNLMLRRHDSRERDVEKLNIQTICFDEDSQFLEVCHGMNQSDRSSVGKLDIKNTLRNPEHDGFAAKVNAQTAQTSFCEMQKNSDDKDDLEMVQGDGKLEKTIVTNTDFSEEGRAGVKGSIQVNSLRFEMSQYTGRVHVYVCIAGVDARPKPIFENFLPEEIEALETVPVKSKNMEDRFLKDDPRFRSALKDFVTEWNLLRAIERRKLVGKPLQIPLSAELSYLNESLNHDHGGLLKSRSKNRITPSSEISHPLPSDAIWKEIHIYSGCGKKDKTYTQGWSCEDEPLCKLCQDPCRHDNAKKPDFFEDLFCNLDCYEEFRLRTSKRCVREALFKIEHGICTNCHLNCHQLVKHIRPLSNEKRQDHIMKVAPNIAKREKLMARLVRSPIDGNAWHADHIVPVYLGGGECRLENMRTLCVACHADVTSAQCAERRLTRARERGSSKKKRRKSKAKIMSLSETEKEQLAKAVSDADLFVHVPGSAYSEPKQTSVPSIRDDAFADSEPKQKSRPLITDANAESEPKQKSIAFITDANAESEPKQATIPSITDANTESEPKQVSIQPKQTSTIPSITDANAESGRKQTSIPLVADETAESVRKQTSIPSITDANAESGPKQTSIPSINADSEPKQASIPVIPDAHAFIEKYKYQR